MGDIWEYYDEPIDIPYPEPRARDPKTDEAKARLVTLFEENPERVFFGRQIEVLLEKEFFHWITARALAELIAEGRIKSEKVALPTGIEVKFCTAKGNPERVNDFETARARIYCRASVAAKLRGAVKAGFRGVSR